MPLSKVIFLLTLILGSCSYLLSEDNYFYINSSYTRQVISFTTCFRIDGPASLTFKSDVLVTQGNHQTTAKFDQEKGLVFDHPFDSDIIGFNNYDLGEYWFGVKVKYDNPQNNHFVQLSMDLTIGDSTTNYVFLMPLFTFPLNALEVAPKNSLRICGGELLLSSRLAFGEFDLSVFSMKDVSSIEVKEKKDWGYFKDDTNGNYLRFKSKQANSLTLIGKGKQQKIKCTVDGQISNVPFEGHQSSYSLRDVFLLSASLDNESYEL